MRKVQLDLSGHTNMPDADVAAIQAAFDALKQACEAVGMAPLKAEFTVTRMGD